MVPVYMYNGTFSLTGLTQRAAAAIILRTSHKPTPMSPPPPVCCVCVCVWIWIVEITSVYV